MSAGEKHPGRLPFDPNNREHKAIVVSAMVAADVLGSGRLNAAREQLEMNDIHISDRDEFARYVLAWGGGIK